MSKTKIDIFSVRDLRTEASSMVRDAENGQISIITKHGKPKAVTLPFNRELLDLGIATDLALHLFENGLVSMKKAAKLADKTLDEFMDLLPERGISAVDYPAEQLDEEMKVDI